MGIPLNRNKKHSGDCHCLGDDFQNANRAENLCYQFEQGQKLLPQFRKIICLVERAKHASG